MEEKRIDLHTHTVCSDGSMTPEELVRHAKNSGLSAVAVSDRHLKPVKNTGSR